jgi:hypothetical protein
VSFRFPDVVAWAAPRLDLPPGLTRPATHGCYGPARTFFLFLAQTLGPDPSCQAAVAAFAAHQAAEGHRVSPNTAAYCKARQRLALDDLRRVHEALGADLEGRGTAAGLWCGRRVWVGDGTQLVLADTPANQAVYPQPRSQAPGCGFPQLRVVGAFDLASGAWRHLAYGSLAQGEHTLLRRVWGAFAPGDVLLYDRHACAFGLLAQGQARGLDAVTRKKGAHKAARLVKTLGPNDRLVAWPKGATRRPRWMKKDAWRALPDELVVREVTVEVADPAVRVERIEVITTLLDPAAYPAAALAELYRRRGEVEAHLDTLKTTLQMETLRGRTPGQVEKELYMHAIGHNLVRALMGEAARKHGVEVRRLSFAGSARLIEAFAREAAGQKPAAQARLYEALLEALVRRKLPQRPGRREPRAVKRRPKNYPRLTAPRHEYRETPHRGKKRAPTES